MMRFLRKSKLCAYAQDTIKRLDVPLRKIQDAQEAHRNVCQGACPFDANLRGAEMQILGRQRILRAEIDALTGGFPWVLSWSSEWHSLLSSPFDDVEICFPDATNLLALPMSPALHGVH